MLISGKFEHSGAAYRIDEEKQSQKNFEKSEKKKFCEMINIPYDYTEHYNHLGGM